MVTFSSNDALAAFSEQFEHHAFRLFGQGAVPGSPDVVNRQYCGWCGCSSSVSAMIWILLLQECNGHMPEHASIERMLWALLMLRNYGTERSNASLCRVYEATYRRWTWWFITKISNLNTSVTHKQHEILFDHRMQFKCLQGKFRHSDWKHAACFHAVTIITQLALENGENTKSCSACAPSTPSSSPPKGRSLSKQERKQRRVTFAGVEVREYPLDIRTKESWSSAFAREGPGPTNLNGAGRLLSEQERKQRRVTFAGIEIQEYPLDVGTEESWSLAFTRDGFGLTTLNRAGLCT